MATLIVFHLVGGSKIYRLSNAPALVSASLGDLSLAEGSRSS